MIRIACFNLVVYVKIGADKCSQSFYRKVKVVSLEVGNALDSQSNCRKSLKC